MVEFSRLLLLLLEFATTMSVFFGLLPCFFHWSDFLRHFAASLICPMEVISLCRSRWGQEKTFFVWRFKTESDPCIEFHLVVKSRAKRDWFSKSMSWSFSASCWKWVSNSFGKRVFSSSSISFLENLSRWAFFRSLHWLEEGKKKSKIRFCKKVHRNWSENGVVLWHWETMGNDIGKGLVLKKGRKSLGDDGVAITFAFQQLIFFGICHRSWEGPLVEVVWEREEQFHEQRKGFGNGGTMKSRRCSKNRGTF